MPKTTLMNRSGFAGRINTNLTFVMNYKTQQSSTKQTFPWYLFRSDATTTTESNNSALLESTIPSEIFIPTNCTWSICNAADHQLKNERNLLYEQKHIYYLQKSRSNNWRRLFRHSNNRFMSGHEISNPHTNNINKIDDQGTTSNDSNSEYNDTWYTAVSREETNRKKKDRRISNSIKMRPGRSISWFFCGSRKCKK